MADQGNGCGKKHLGCHCVQCRAAYDAASGNPGGTSVRQAHTDEVNRRLKERGFAPGELQATMRGLRGDHLAPFTRDEIELGLLDAFANMGGATVWVGDGSSCAAQIVEHLVELAKPGGDAGGTPAAGEKDADRIAELGLTPCPHAEGSGEEWPMLECELCVGEFVARVRAEERAESGEAKEP